jgi:hypothetical protein
LTWATPCDGNRECIDDSDEEGCETPIWILGLILFGVGFFLVVTLFLYSFKTIKEVVRNITYDEDMSNDTSKNKHLHIAILTEKNDIKMIEQLFINEVKMQRNEGEAICSFKVFYFHGSFKHRIQRTEVHN